MRCCSIRSVSGHRQWADAYLLRLARKHGLQHANNDIPVGIIGIGA